MSVGIRIAETNGIYFLTFTCFKWMRLFELTNAYDLVYKWFDYLKDHGHYISGYVIMPNHLHAIIGFKSSGRSITQIISNGKRFMAYGLVERLKKTGCDNILSDMHDAVTRSDNKRGKIHQVFQPSFDCKGCFSSTFVLQKLEYIHKNPCRGKWDLCTSPELYPHSSAYYYETGDQGIYPVTNIGELLNLSLD